jgi:hypothetical protein
VSRCELQNDGNWKDGILWDELMEVKTAVGFGERWAVEVFPPDAHLVNVANMRHLWITHRPPFAWVKNDAPADDILGLEPDPLP